MFLVPGTINSFVDKLTDFFQVKPLELHSFSVLQGGSNAVSELVVRNNLNTSQQFNWRLNTSQGIIASNNAIALNSSDVFVYIASNYSTGGVYRATGFVNSSTYNDTQTGAVIV